MKKVEEVCTPVKQVLRAVGGEFRSSPPEWSSRTDFVGSFSVETVAVRIAQLTIEDGESLLACIVGPPFSLSSHWARERGVENIQDLLRFDDAAQSVVAREALHLAAQVVEDEALFQYLVEVGHFLWRRALEFEFSQQVMWDDPYNPLLQGLGELGHRMKSTVRSSGRRHQVCTCGFDFAPLSERRDESVEQRLERQVLEIESKVHQILQFMSEFALFTSASKDETDEGPWREPDWTPIGWYQADWHFIAEAQIEGLSSLLSASAQRLVPELLGRFVGVAKSEGWGRFHPKFLDDIGSSSSEYCLEYESLTALAAFRLAADRRRNRKTRRAFSEIGHVLLSYVDDMAATGFGFGWRVVDPQNHRYLEEVSACCCSDA